MKLIEWNESLYVGNATIDEQHQQIIRLTNNLIQHSNAECSSELISESLTELIKYYRTHFVTEENFLRERNYPKLDYHISLHTQFIKEVALFSKDVLDKDKSVTHRIIKFLIKWVVNHVTTEDQDYKKYL